MNSGGSNQNNRRRDIVTPAMREADRKSKEAATVKKAPVAASDKKTPSRTADERRRDIERRRGGTSSSATASSGRPVYGSQPKSTKRVSDGTNDDLQKQLLEQQRQIEMLQKQIRAEKEERSEHAAQNSKIRELERKLQHQRLINEGYLDRKNNESDDMHKKNIKIVALAAIAILIVANIIVFSKLSTKTIPQKQPSDNTAVPQIPEIQQQEAQDVPLIDATKETVSVLSSDYQRGVLALVNSEHSYNFDYIGSDITDGELVTVAGQIPNKAYKAADYKIFLNTETVEMLNIMMPDFYAYSGKNDVMINTAHRSYEQQKSIYDSKVIQLGEDQQIAQTPGNSEHHTGYAFDLAIYPANENGSTFINVSPYSWIYENCHKYGFVLRYPEGKTVITGIAPESWHFRYVGVPHATYMASKNKTLEEYITDISIYPENIPLTISVSETESYSVFYVKKSDGVRTEFTIPKNTEYQISGDNVGGFIVWYNNADVGKKGTASSEASSETAPEIQENNDNA